MAQTPSPQALREAARLRTEQHVRPLPTEPGVVIAPPNPDDAGGAMYEGTAQFGGMSGILEGLGINAPMAGGGPSLMPQVDMRSLSEFWSVRGDDEGAARKSAKYCYWAKADEYIDGVPTPDGGWIIVAPSWSDEAMINIDLGLRPLKKYGTFTLNNAREGWDVVREPFRRIFQRNGAKEFPVDQIVQYGWHRKPPYRGVAFPQLAGIEIKDYPCPICGPRRTFSTEEDLRKHESVMHRPDQQNNQLARTLTVTTGAMNAPLTQALTQVAQSVAEGQRMMAVMFQQMQQANQQTAIMLAQITASISPQVVSEQPQRPDPRSAPATASQAPQAPRTVKVRRPERDGTVDGPMHETIEALSRRVSVSKPVAAKKKAKKQSSRSKAWTPERREAQRQKMLGVRPGTQGKSAEPVGPVGPAEPAEQVQ